jgi:hypothetical protein
MRRWLAGEIQLPGLDEDTFFEVVPDDEKRARQRREIQLLRRCFLDFKEAWEAGNPGAMRDAVHDMRRELDRQEADLEREERMAKKRGR